MSTVAEMRAARRQLAGTVGAVPTMGYLHAGHLELVRQARAENDHVLVSIFVNPTQFGPGEDLARYPRDLPRDLALLAGAGVDVVFTPSAEEMYPPGYATYVVPQGPLAERLEAATRPGHFRGVATVVAHLLLVLQPDRVYLGQKDAQQVAVIRRMVADLHLPGALRVVPTVREADGLALSSRNVYLSAQERAAAPVLYRALRAGQRAWEARPAVGVEAVRAAILAEVASEPRATLDYIDLCDPESFEPLTTQRAPALLALAARVGPARLIDNILLRADGTWDLGQPRP